MTFNKFLLGKVIGITTLMACSSIAFAVPASEKTAVLKQASNYAQAVACNTTFSKNNEGRKTSAKDVYLVEVSGFDGTDEFGSKYIVYWGGDYACAGGSGTYSYYLTSFSRFSDTRPFLMEKENILDDLNNIDELTYQINTRFIKDIKFTNGKFIITASDYSNDKNDHEGNNFPANLYKYTVVYDENEDKWRLENKEFLGKNK